MELELGYRQVKGTAARRRGTGSGGRRATVPQEGSPGNGAAAAEAAGTRGNEGHQRSRGAGEGRTEGDRGPGLEALMQRRAMHV